MEPAELDGIAAILMKYADQRFDLADATLMYLADREEITSVFTVDQRHFATFRRSKGERLSLLPMSP